MALLRSGGGQPLPDPVSAERCEALIESLGLTSGQGWSARALLIALRSLATCADAGVLVVDASLRDDESFAVTYRRGQRGGRAEQVLGSVGDRDPDATLLLMPHLEPHEVPLDPQTYGAFFSIVGIQEPFGPEHYSQPDANGVRWLNPPDFRVNN